MLGGWEIVGILVLVLILFGAKKLPELARGLGTGIKEFKKATREVTDELQTAIDTDTPPAPPQRNLPPADETDTGHTVARSDESSSSETKS